MSAMPRDTSSADSTPLGRHHIRHTGRELLSLALMDSRKQTLQLLAAFEQAAGSGLTVLAAKRWNSRLRRFALPHRDDAFVDFGPPLC